MIYCNSVKIGIAIKSTMRTKLIVSFDIRCTCICYHSLFLTRTPFIPRANRSTDFYCVGYKIKANTNTSSNIKRQRYKTNVKFAGIASFSLLHMDTPSFGWFVGFDWQFGFRQTHTHTTTFMENIKTCKMNTASSRILNNKGICNQLIACHSNRIIKKATCGMRITNRYVRWINF